MIRTITSIMNLLDKLNYKTGLAMLPALFFLFSCEDPSEIGLDLNPRQSAISTHFVELPVESSQLYIDSIRSAVPRNAITSSGANPAQLIRIGRNADANFGELKATAFANFGAPSTVPSIPAGASADSAFLRITLQAAFLGTNIGATQELNIYRLPEPIRPKSKKVGEESGVTELNFDYFTFDQQSLEGAELIGQISFDTASLTSNVLKIPLTSAFANRVVRKAIEGDSVLFSDQLAFDEFMGSLAIVPGDANTFINDYNLFAPTTRIDIHHSGSSAALTFRFVPREQDKLLYVQMPVYFGLEEDLSNTPLANAPNGGPKQVFEPTDNRLYFRSGTGFVPRFDFTAFHDFINSDTLGRFIINQAVLEIDSVIGSSDNLGIPSQLALFFLDENNNRINGVVTSPSAGIPVNATRFITNEEDTLFQYTNSFGQQNNREVSLERGLEQYIQTGNAQAGDENYLRSVLYPVGSMNSLRNFIAEPGKVTLKIYYTSLKEQ